MLMLQLLLVFWQSAAWPTICGEGAAAGEGVGVGVGVGAGVARNQSSELGRFSTLAKEQFAPSEGESIDIVGLSVCRPYDEVRA